MKVGDLVQWTINGRDQFAAPQRVRMISDCGGFCFVDGSETGLPADQLKVMITERFTFFYNGPFSQFHRSRFAVNKQVYCCSEQYMMASKARLFNDQGALKLILESTDPHVHKATGRMVLGFDKKKWEAVARDFVYIGNKAKFTQNLVLLGKLFATQGTTLVEASEDDRIWGIGLREGDPRCQSRETWRGSNWLGETLTRLRDDLMKDGH